MSVMKFFERTPEGSIVTDKEAAVQFLADRQQAFWRNRIEERIVALESSMAEIKNLLKGLTV